MTFAVADSYDRFPCRYSADSCELARDVNAGFWPPGPPPRRARRAHRDSGGARSPRSSWPPSTSSSTGSGTTCRSVSARRGRPGTSCSGCRSWVRAIVLAARMLLPGDGGHEPLGASASHRRRSCTPRARTRCDRLAGVRRRARPGGAALRSRLGRRPCGRALSRGSARRTDACSRPPGSFSAISALFGGPLVAGMLLLEAGVGHRRLADPDPDPRSRRGLDRLPDLHRARRLGRARSDGALGARAAGLRRRASSRPSARDRCRSRAGAVHRGRPAAGDANRGTMACAAGNAAALAAAERSPSALWRCSRTVSARARRTCSSRVRRRSRACSPRTRRGSCWCCWRPRALAYAICLGCGFRGGPVFPAIFLGVALAMLAVIAFDMSPTLALAVGTAAGMAAMTRLIFSLADPRRAPRRHGRRRDDACRGAGGRGGVADDGRDRLALSRSVPPL